MHSHPSVELPQDSASLLLLIEIHEETGWLQQGPVWAQEHVEFLFGHGSLSIQRLEERIYHDGEC